jgi:hypothetical protein
MPGIPPFEVPAPVPPDATADGTLGVVDVSVGAVPL